MRTFQLNKTIFASLALIFGSQALAGPVNINAASGEELDLELHGVGPVIAQRIIDYREQHGPYTDAQQLLDIKGIGDKTLARNADFILLQ